MLSFSLKCIIFDSILKTILSALGATNGIPFNSCTLMAAKVSEIFQNLAHKHPKLADWLNQLWECFFFVIWVISFSLMAFPFFCPWSCPLWKDNIVQQDHKRIAHVCSEAAMSWHFNLKARKTTVWPSNPKKHNIQIVPFQHFLFNNFTSFSASLFFSYSLYQERTQILITWWDYTLYPCVCNRACGFSYNLHEPL